MLRGMAYLHEIFSGRQGRAAAALTQSLARWPEPESAREVDRIVSRLRRGSRNYARNVALVYILYGTGLTVREIAGLRVGDFLSADNQPRTLSEVRAEIAFNGRARPLLWASPRLRSAVYTYLAERGRVFDDSPRVSMRYHGFDPASPLILDDSGLPFNGGLRSARAMSDLCRSILSIEDDGVHRTARRARRMFARSLCTLGASIEDMELLLGLNQRRHLFALLGDMASRFADDERDERLTRLAEMVV